jgi:hypothetical protein
MPLPEKNHSDRVKRKVADVHFPGIPSEKRFTRFSLVSSQENFEKNVRVSQKHYLHSAALC